mmetsp:Transcript_137254/g.426537  ORF Transcript_137254/g.426537 Transcript_137254/m.426537 type:complete len:124 (+) Transcript_137254:46-417(+)
MAVRVHNRTFGAWDQFIFNQELDGAQVPCCWSKGLRDAFEWKFGVHFRKQPLTEGETRCAPLHGPALDPPKGVKRRFKWKPWRFNEGGWHGKRSHTHCTECPNWACPAATPAPTPADSETDER